MKYIQLLSFILLVSCSEDQLCIERLEKYPSNVTGYNYFVFDNSQTFKFDLCYDSNGRISKRIGGFKRYRNDLPYLTFSNDVFDSVIYEKDKILIKTIEKEEFNGKIYQHILKKETYLISDNGQLVKKYLNDYNSRHYFYNKTNKISETVDSIKVTPSNIYVTFASYYYSDNGNLEKIEYRYKTGNYQATDDDIDTTYIEFSDFDNAPNPFRELQIFSDVFIRSLSENNYRSYNSDRHGSGEFIFNYDECGNLNFFD